MTKTKRNTKKTARPDLRSSITLSDRDFNRLLSALDRPPKPNAALKKAMAKYLDS
jgi:uncharacterized protein (DUF1778 family)